VKERPIIFSGDMVKALLTGTKTQTRRIVRPGFALDTFNFLDADGITLSQVSDFERKKDDGGVYRYTGLLAQSADYPGEGAVEVACPYGIAGDRLWVRETWARNPEIHATVPGACLYRANRGGDYQGAAQGDFKWKSSRFMPRWASRITLEILKVRVERLQDVSEKDAKAEGMNGQSTKFHETVNLLRPYAGNYAALWDSLHGKGAWENNPWVWVIEFQPVKTALNRFAARGAV
jgi:hypothetical protein